MYYISKEPNAAGYHGNPISQAFPDSVGLPDVLLSAYLEAKGFVILTVEDDIVTNLSTNQEALDAYNEAHPDIPPEPEKDSWTELAEAYREGVNDA